MEAERSDRHSDIHRAREKGQTVSFGGRNVEILTALGFPLSPRTVFLALGRVKGQLVDIERRGSAGDPDNVIAASQVDDLSLDLVFEDGVNASVHHAAFLLITRS